MLKPSLSLPEIRRDSMKDVFDEATNLLKDGIPLVLATVIDTKGSTPQKSGAKLLVREDGSGVGTLGGGCVEGDIWFAAKELMKSKGGPQYRDYELNEELAAEDGLVCGGTMYFLIDPVYEPDQFLNFSEQISKAYQGNGSVALATIIKNGSNTNLKIGSKMMINHLNEITGSLGNKKLEDDACRIAKKLMIHGGNQYLKTEDGSECFIEAFTTPPQLVLCGGGHVSKAIASLAKPLGFQLFITDDRHEFSNSGRFPEADLLVNKKPEEALKELPINPNTFIIIATRGHRYDNVALEAAARTSASFVGLLGSKRKTILIYEDLLRDGIPIERVREIRSPLGLSINARTPEEIAISIISEILMFRLGGDGSSMKLEDWRIDRINNKIQSETPETSLTD